MSTPYRHLSMDERALVQLALERGEDRRARLRNTVSIHQRPPDIEERLIPGHREGDLIKGQRGACAVGTLVERTTLFVTLAKIPGPSAADAVEGFSHVLQRVDVQCRLSLTCDRGLEMARHEQLTELTGIKVHFADPHSPWQRARNENKNGLLRPVPAAQRRPFHLHPGSTRRDRLGT